MAQTLEYRLQQNQVEQSILNYKATRRLDRAYDQALRWIEKKNPALAEALRDSRNHELVFTELCRVYGHQLWKPNENEVYIWSRYNLILYIEIQLYKIVGTNYDFGAGLFLAMMPTIIITVVCTAVVAISLPPHWSLILLCIYLGSVLVRIILKRAHIRYNLKWYTPIYRLYDFQNRHKKQIQALKEMEEDLTQSLNLIKEAEMRRFKDDGAWFYRALAERKN
jgi:hypothetical protein